MALLYMNNNGVNSLTLKNKAKNIVTINDLNSLLYNNKSQYISYGLASEN